MQALCSVSSIAAGYAVAHYGYPRAGGDLDIWIAANETNEGKTARALPGVKRFVSGIRGSDSLTFP